MKRNVYLDHTLKSRETGKDVKKEDSGMGKCSNVIAEKGFIVSQGAVVKCCCR
jgi:hypothetical protein